MGESGVGGDGAGWEVGVKRDVKGEEQARITFFFINYRVKKKVYV